MDNLYENIIPWNGANDTGRDVRLKWERNFSRVASNFDELEQTCLTLIEDAINNVLRKDQPDSTDYLTGFNAGITIGAGKKELYDIIRSVDSEVELSDTSVYSSLAMDERYISKYQPDSTLYPVDFTAGLSINSKRIGDVIRYYMKTSL